MALSYPMKSMSYWGNLLAEETKEASMKQREKKLTAIRIMLPPLSPDGTEQSHKFLTKLRASGYRGRALKRQAELERQRLAEKRLQRVQKLAKSST